MHEGRWTYSQQQCDFLGSLQDDGYDKMKHPVAIAMGFLLLLCSLRHLDVSCPRPCRWFPAYRTLHLWLVSPPKTDSQDISRSFLHTTTEKTLGKALATEEWGPTVTVEIPPVLPSSLLADLSLDSGSIMCASRTSSSYVIHTYVPGFHLVGIPAAVLVIA